MKRRSNVLLAIGFTVIAFMVLNQAPDDSMRQLLGIFGKIIANADSPEEL